MINDPISDFLARIKNAYLSRYKTVEAPYIRILERIAAILAKEGYVDNVTTTEKDGHKLLSVTLKYTNRKPGLSDIKRVSKPGLRVYVSKNEIPYVLGGIGTVVISTSQGMMTGKEAKAKQVGGEVVCKVW